MSIIRKAIDNLKGGWVYELYKKTPVFKIRGAITQRRDIADWIKRGRPVPPPHPIKQANLIEFQDRFGLRLLIETGTFTGDMVEALRRRFDAVISIELSFAYFQAAVRRFRKRRNVFIIFGDSGEVLPRLLPSITQPALFWLDGHYSGGATAKSALETPVFQELEAIFNHPIKNHVVLIDDARMFVGASDYPTLGALRDFVRSRRPQARFEVADDSIRIYEEKA